MFNCSFDLQVIRLFDPLDVEALGGKVQTGRCSPAALFSRHAMCVCHEEKLPARSPGRHGIVVVKSYLWPRCSNSLCVRKNISTDLPRDTMLQTIGPMSFVLQAVCIDGN